MSETIANPQHAPGVLAPKPVEVGDWVVARTGYSDIEAFGPIERVTAALVWGPSALSRRASRIDKGNVMACGAEIPCKELVERIVSSRALANQERRAAETRHAARVEKLVASFFASPVDGGE